MKTTEQKWMLARELRILQGNNNSGDQSDLEDSLLTIDYYDTYARDALTFYKRFAQLPNEHELYMIYKYGIAAITALPNDFVKSNRL